MLRPQKKGSVPGANCLNSAPDSDQAPQISLVLIGSKNQYYQNGKI